MPYYKLTHSEYKVLTALQGVFVMYPAQLAKMHNIPAATVYHSLDSLHAMGLVTRKPDRSGDILRVSYTMTHWGEKVNGLVGEIQLLIPEAQGGLR